MIKAVAVVSLGVVVVVLALLNPKDVLRSRGQFKHWYSQYSYQFKILSRDLCTQEYSVYLYGTRQNTEEVTLSGSGKYTLFIQPMINCLLENSSDYIKYQLGSSQVMLGITPTIIALLGASSEELCLLALIGRRRLLGLLLAASSPSIYTERAFKYQDPDKILKERQYGRPDSHDYHDGHGDGYHVIPTMPHRWRWFFVSLEYVAASFALTNIATLNWQLGAKSVNSLSPNTVLMPMLWSLFGIITHLGGAVVFDMRARRLDKENEPAPRSTLGSSLQIIKIQGPCSAIVNIYNAVKKKTYHEFCWDSEGENQKLYFRLIPESRSFTLMAWFLSIIVIFHIIFGTLILSSTMFVGPKDALGIMARYILSVIICRIILVYELAVLRVEHRNATNGGSEATSVQPETKVMIQEVETGPV